MFTGIVEEVGTIQQLDPTSVVISAQQMLQGVEVKDSVAVDGVCLTVVERGNDWFRVETMPETRRRTRLNYLQTGEHVNLERSLAADGRIGGHIVQGHIESTVAVLSVEQDGMALLVTIELPENLRPYVVSKGFVALNGVSLTVVECLVDRFSVALIPYTLEHTNLGEVRPGTWFNLETDIMGKYVVKFLRQSNSTMEPDMIYYPYRLMTK
ncbi:MAG: riboflavin synthase [Ktedonobacteraceae bacterium]